MCRKAGKYEIGRTKILWGLHLFISTYFPDCCFPLLDISLCQNEHHTTHFKVTFPTQKRVTYDPLQPTQPKNFPDHPTQVFQVGLELSFTNIWERTYEIHSIEYFLGVNYLKRTAKSRRSKVGLGFNGHLRTAADPNMPLQVQKYAQMAKEKVIKLTNMEKV